MSTDLKLNAEHDIYLENGDLVLATDGEEVAQSCKIRLLTVEAEWILDFLLGLPWFDRIMRVNTSLAEKEGYIKNAIRETEGVREIISFEIGFDFENHAMSIEHETDTIYGPIIDRIVT
jgi:hypothetical protein